MNEEFVIKVSADGSEVVADGKGFTGGKCEDFIKKTVDILGEVREMKRKPEFNIQGGAGQKVGA